METTLSFSNLFNSGNLLPVQGSLCRDMMPHVLLLRSPDPVPSTTHVFAAIPQRFIDASLSRMYTMISPSRPLF
jgi:hypothetical protein